MITEKSVAKSDTEFRLKNSPIVEAVVDIDCDLPPNVDLAALEVPARAVFEDRYPKVRKQFIHEHQFEVHGIEPRVASKSSGLQALQFASVDEKQLVQVRSQGFSFNRLAPYSTLDDYLPEIERSWQLFRNVTNPLQIRRIGLRYINRILLPIADDTISFEEYLQISPRLPDEENLRFVSFFRQHTAVEKSTGNQVKIVLTTQRLEATRLPLIFDNTAIREETIDPSEWNKILERIGSLRRLQNRVFQNTLTKKCLELFQS